ncbi:MAG: DNA polymerase domain-containing protein [Thermoplasmatota archaeon]
MRGWILDVSPDGKKDLMDIWVVGEDGKRFRLSHWYRPVITVSGDRRRLRDLAEFLSAAEGVRNCYHDRAVLDVHHEHESDCLRVEISKYGKLREIARSIERAGGYRDFSLYDVDIRLATRYMAGHGTYPLAHVDIGREFRVLDDPDWGSQPLPPLKALSLHVKPRKSGPVPLMSDPIGSISLGGRTFESSEEEMIRDLVGVIREEDPDILATAGGDSFVFPYLYHRAVLNGIEEELILDRSGKAFRAPRREGRSYFTYGNIFFKPAAHTLKGRLHLDMENSFVLREGGLVGLAILSRMSLLALQDMSRLSPGSAISYMECVEAVRRGRNVRWKKNLPEEWKNGIELAKADRGGHFFDPIVGAFSDVLEMDFSSFYPHIMWRKNLSVETLNCRCCHPAADNTVPGLNYHVCRKKEGLIPFVVGDILTRRLEYKRLSKRGEVGRPFPEEGDLGDLIPPMGRRYSCGSNILKWVLVTSFGYTGYKNARFGRIEAHESITAYARDLMLQAKEVVEERGFRILHGIVDCLWISGPTDAGEEVAGAAEERIGIPIEVDEVYRWIVFLPNKTNGAGALTKYFGLRSNGNIKMRGIETRQHSTPPFIKEVQEEVINTLAGADSAGGLPDEIPKVFSVLRRRGRELMDREVNPRDLALTIRVSRALDEYSANSEQVSALKLLRSEGMEVRAGEKVRFVILDHGERRPEGRVCLMQEDMDGVEYDVNRYMELTARAAAGVLSVFNIDEGDVLRGLKGVEQKGLSDF